MSMLGTRGNSRPSLVRMFLKADSAEELVRLQLQTNIEIMGRIDLADIQFVDGSWYGWFLVDVDHNPQFLEQVNGDQQRTRG